MKEAQHQIKAPDAAEAVFDAAYLLFDLVAGILFLAKSGGSALFVLYGVLTLTLCGGDAFHLIPRIRRALQGENERIRRQLGIGLQVSSITMTVFYVILLYIWKLTYPELEAPYEIVEIIWITAVIRIIVCLLPQNDWTGEGNRNLSYIRNGVFALTGLAVIVLYLISRNLNGYHMTWMVAAILISFACYIPVTLFSKSHPRVGMLMVPKTCAYIWMIAMRMRLLYR